MGAPPHLPPPSRARAAPRDRAGAQAAAKGGEVSYLTRYQNGRHVSLDSTCNIANVYSWPNKKHFFFLM